MEGPVDIEFTAELTADALYANEGDLVTFNIHIQNIGDDIEHYDFQLGEVLNFSRYSPESSFTVSRIVFNSTIQEISALM